jgi:hypothetical protein
MMPPPNFGQHGSKGKFGRWVRCLGEGPEKAKKNDPWREVRWLVDGHNDNRWKTIKPSCVCKKTFVIPNEILKLQCLRH